MKHEIAPGVAWQMVADEAVLVDLESGNAMGLNETGSLIWSNLESHDLDHIAALVADRFGIDGDAAQHDVNSFVAGLVDRGLLIAGD